MSTIVRIGLIQGKWEGAVDATLTKYEALIDEAASMGVRVLCLPELFHAPFFPLDLDAKWHALAESIPGPTSGRMQRKSEEHGVVLIVPLYEKVISGVYHNTVVVFDADGSMLGRYRKVHIPTREDCSEKFYFRPGNLGFPVFATRYAKVGVCICYDRHFPEGLRVLGLNGADIVFIPTASSIGRWKSAWEIELRSSALANGYFVACVNRVGLEEACRTGFRFYGASSICAPTGELIAKGSEDAEEIVVADLDLGMVDQTRSLLPFYRDRRPDVYGRLLEA
jgi:N-carbamoylputrescine amidase